MARIIVFLSICLICKTLPIKASYFTDTTQIQLQLIKTIEGKYSNFYIDNLGNLFLVTPTQQIKKYSINLDSVGIFNDVKRFGNMDLLDVSNPLKVLVYYKNFANIIVLDRQLNSRNTIYLRQQNLFQVSTIAQSYDNNIWIFDEVNYRLKKIDETGKLLFESADFRFVFNNQTVAPNTIIDNNGFLYLYHPTQGFMVFDYYGAFKTQYPLYNWQHVQVVDNWLLGNDDKYFYRYQSKQQQFNVLKPNISLSNIQKIAWLQKNCYMLTAKGLLIYKLL